METPMTKRTKERPSVEAGFPKGPGSSKQSKGVIDVTEQRDWPPRASWVDKVTEKGDILTLGD